MNEMQRMSEMVQVTDFLVSTNTDFSVKFCKHDKYFPDDEVARDIWEVTLSRGDKVYSFMFGQSVANKGVENIIGVKVKV